MIRTKEFKLNKYIRYGDELYDLRKDSDELRNLANVPKYAQKLDKWIKNHNDNFYTQKATTRSGGSLDQQLFNNHFSLHKNSD